jgi:acetylornithine/succinyldiaminopimelate/putrescine aminotransferase
LAAGDGDVVRLAPPLVISEAEVQKGVDVLASAMEEVLGKKEGYHEEEAVVAAA